LYVTPAANSESKSPFNSLHKVLLPAPGSPQSTTKHVSFGIRRAAAVTRLCAFQNRLDLVFERYVHLSVPYEQKKRRFHTFEKALPSTTSTHLRW
jgi:hypothetical protein